MISKGKNLIKVNALFMDEFAGLIVVKMLDSKAQVTLPSNQGFEGM